MRMASEAGFSVLYELSPDECVDRLTAEINQSSSRWNFGRIKSRSFTSSTIDSDCHSFNYTVTTSYSQLTSEGKICDKAEGAVLEGIINYKDKPSLYLLYLVFLSFILFSGLSFVAGKSVIPLLLSLVLLLMYFVALRRTRNILIEDVINSLKLEGVSSQQL